MSEQTIGRLAEPEEIHYHGVVLSRDGSVLTDVIFPYVANGTYELAETLVLRRTLSRSDVVLELGTGLGYLTTQCCRMVGDAAVHTVEANPALIPYIRRTFARNGVAPAFENCMLGPEEGEVLFHAHPDFWVSSALPVPGAQTVKVPQRSLAQTLDRIRPTYLLVDIEGGEIDLFRYAVLDGIQKICIEFHPDVTGHSGVSDAVARLIAQGFDLDLEVSEKLVLFFRRPVR